MSCSDIELEEYEEDVMEEIYEKDIEQVLVGSSSEEDVETFKSENIVYKKAVSKPQMEEKDETVEDYNRLQKLISANDRVPAATWPKNKIIKKGTLLCEELYLQESNLRVQSEMLLQRHCMLRRRVEKLKKQKKRKSATVLTRRASGPILGDPQKISPMKRASLDDAIMKDLPEPKPAIKEDVEEKKIFPPLQYKNPRKKTKKRIGLSDEEKEFYRLEEKIEDLLFEVDTLWNEVKDDEEVSEDEKFDINRCAGVEKKSSEDTKPVKNDLKKEEVTKCVEEEEITVSAPQAMEVAPLQVTEASKSLPAAVDITKNTATEEDVLANTDDKVTMAEVKVVNDNSIKRIEQPKEVTTSENTQPSNMNTTTFLLVPIKLNVIGQNAEQAPTTSISGQSQSEPVEVINISDGSESDSSEILFVD